MKLLLDNSAISLLHCKRRFQLAVIEGKRTIANDIANMGNALHVVNELTDKGDTLDNVLPTVRERYPMVDMAKVITTSTIYKTLTKLPPPIDINGKPAVEIKFKFLYATVDTPKGQVEVYLVGTIDRIYLDKDRLVFLDYKSGLASTDYQVDKTISEYDLTFQLPFYVYCMKNSGTLPAVYKDYIENHQYRTEIHFLFYNITPPVIKKRAWQPFNSDFIDREVPFIINNKIQEAVNVMLMDHPAPHDGLNVYKACGYCPFKPACLSMGTERELEFLARYESTPYDPLSFR